MDTRERIIAAAMHLFGTQGYTATTIAQIEDAAGLSGGSGALYRHFRSKHQLLKQGVIERIEADDGIDDLATRIPPGAEPRDVLRAIAAAGLARLDADADLSRVLVRDLSAFPDLLELFRSAELERLHRLTVGVLRTLGAAPDADVEAVAAILMAALSHYWLFRDVWGVHPLMPDADRYLDALADLAARAITQGEEK